MNDSKFKRLCIHFHLEELYFGLISEYIFRDFLTIKQVTRLRAFIESET